MSSIPPDTASRVAAAFFPFFSAYATHLIDALTASKCTVTISPEVVQFYTRLEHLSEFSEDMREILAGLVERHVREEHDGLEGCNVWNAVAGEGNRPTHLHPQVGKGGDAFEIDEKERELSILEGKKGSQKNGAVAKSPEEGGFDEEDIRELMAAAMEDMRGEEAQLSGPDLSNRAHQLPSEERARCVDGADLVDRPAPREQE